MRQDSEQLELVVHTFVRDSAAVTVEFIGGRNQLGGGGRVRVPRKGPVVVLVYYQ